MKIKDLFDYKYGVNLELINCEITKDRNNTVNFVARTSQNNGVVAKVKRIDNLQPQKAGTLSLAVSGSVLSCFVQTEEYYSGRDLYILTPKVDLSLEQKLYYATVINKNKYRYSYGRAANKTFPYIDIPSLEECNRYISHFKIKHIRTAVVRKNDINLNIDEWKEFKVKDIFERIEPTKGTTTKVLEAGDEICYIAARKDDNGFMEKVAKAGNDMYISEGNCIVFIQLGQGSAGYVTYQPVEFIGMSGKTSCGYNKNLNKYNALFLVTILDLERPKYSFGRSWTGDRLLNTKIKLPTLNEKPDWMFMENYIKSLLFSDRI